MPSSLPAYCGISLCDLPTQGPEMREYTLQTHRLSIADILIPVVHLRNQQMLLQSTY